MASGAGGSALSPTFPTGLTLLCRLREWQESPSVIHMPLKVLLMISHSCQMLGEREGSKAMGLGVPESRLLPWGSKPLPSPGLPEDPTVGIPAEGLLVLGHVVERAEFILVPGSTGTSGALQIVPTPPASLALTWTPLG